MFHQKSLSVSLVLPDEIVELVLLGIKVGQIGMEVRVSSGKLVVARAAPVDHVFRLFLHETDA